MIECRFCQDEAIARFTLSEGCAVYPEDRVQDLCFHHIIKAQPISTFELIQDYTLSQNVLETLRSWGPSIIGSVSREENPKIWEDE